ncbi:Peptidyl-prolyl cis-trans isomerase D [Anaerobiospirillum thomasii]|uniref:SurA N-terminal domain-containing protein n=1 Tax=Anaerobiospirillum thomasii TaxID=179995 RepID=UPI000D9C3551|nr:SurA N-terminal domain-containing protein [Anaerobiospirillum thomasii]SPT68097.1 Peptidyl-prolyl cis-trans isomerase D [Anaerobiospirillum thomasii]
MLSDTLRAGAESRVFKIILFLIILSFIFTGVGGYLIPRLNTDPVTVGEYKISAQEWNNQYNQQAQMLQRNYGAQAVSMLENPQYVKELKTQILENLIDNVAFNAAVYDANVRIGDNQVKDVIRSNPAFIKDGKFNNDLYIATVRNMGITPEYYGEQMRVSLMSTSVSEPLMRLASIPFDYEVKALSDVVSKVRYVDLYSIDKRDLTKSIKPSDDEVMAYYKDNSDKFKSPAVSKFNYIVLDMAKLMNEVVVNDEKLDEYFNMHHDDFKVAQRRGVYHLAVAKGSEAQSKIDAIKADLKAGTSFVDVADKYGINKDNIDLGLISRGSVAPNLEEAVFAIDGVGGVSDAIVDDFGTHFVGVYKIEEEHTPSLSEVKSEVRTAYINEEARKLFNEKSQTLADMSFENPDSLDATAKALNLEIMDSGDFSYGDSKAVWPLNTKAMQEAAFNEENINSHMNSSPVNISDSVVAVINIYDYKASALKSFDEVKDEAYALTVDSQSVKKAEQLLQDYAKSIAAGSAKDPEGIEIKSSKNIALPRGDNAYDPEFGMAVYAIENAKNAYTIATNKGVPTLAVLLEEKADPNFDATMYNSALSVQMMQLNSQMGATMLRQGARELNEIVYNQEAIDLVLKTDEME